MTAGLGAVRMDDLSPLAIERFYAELLKTGGRRGQGLSAKSVRNTHVALRKALADAEHLELIDRTPAARARPPKGERVEIVTWTSAQVTQFLRGVADDPLFALWVLLATTGLRSGEALGLRWKDVDLQRATPSVSQTITAVQHGVIVSPPKSDRGRRRLGLDPDTVLVLADHQQAQQRDRDLLGLGPVPLSSANPRGSPSTPTP